MIYLSNVTYFMIYLLLLLVFTLTSCKWYYQTFVNHMRWRLFQQHYWTHVTTFKFFFLLTFISYTQTSGRCVMRCLVSSYPVFNAYQNYNFVPTYYSDELCYKGTIILTLSSFPLVKVCRNTIILSYNLYSTRCYFMFKHQSCSHTNDILYNTKTIYNVGM